MIMTSKAGGNTYEAFIAVGWTDALLIQYGYAVEGSAPRPRANQRVCLIGMNRKKRKRFCRQMFKPMIGMGDKRPLWEKKLRREARHSEQAFERAESMGLYGNHNYV